MRQLRALRSSATGIIAVVIVLGLIVLSIIGPVLFTEQASAIEITQAWQKPSAEHLLGTDELGRDILARTIVATRLSLISAGTAALIAIAVGIPIGLLASAFGPRLSGAFQSVVQVAIAFPALLTAMFVGTVIGIGVPGAVIGVGIAMAPIFARLTQTLTQSVVALDYVAAARTMGIPLPVVIGRHILPNVAEPLIIQAATSVGIALLGISALSFLGLGARPPEYDWGGLLGTGLDAIYVSPAAALGAGLLIALAGISFNLIGEVVAGSIGENQAGRQANRVAKRMARDAARRPRAVLPAADPGLLLEVQDLRVGFPSEHGELAAVRGVSFSLAPGERTGIVGESGSGKSVTVMAIAQLVEHPAVVTADRIAFGGTEIDSLDRRSLRRFLSTNLAMVFQNPMSSLNPAHRIGTQISEVARVQSHVRRAAARERVIVALDEVGIADPEQRLKQYPHEFSGGMRQRAMIAMGLMEKPRLIIADEPTTALDVTVQAQILDLLAQINRDEGAGILLISHDIAVIAQACERVLVMYAGQIVEDLPTSALLESAAHPYTRALIASVPDMATDRDRELATIPGRPPSIAEIPVGCPFAARCAFATDICRTEMPPLETHEPGHRFACWHPQSGTVVERTGEDGAVA